jgi:hypothetical protein
VGPMSKWKMALTLAGFVVAVGLGLPTRAAPPPSGSCPEGWTLVGVNQAIDTKTAKEVDRGGNHDQFVCEKPVGPQYIDNDS